MKRGNKIKKIIFWLIAAFIWLAFIIALIAIGSVIISSAIIIFFIILGILVLIWLTSLLFKLFIKIS